MDNPCSPYSLFLLGIIDKSSAAAIDNYSKYLLQNSDTILLVFLQRTLRWS